MEKLARIVQAGAEETFYEFQSNYWRHIRTNNPLERVNREIRRGTRVVGNFPNGHSALMLVAARLRLLSVEKCGLGYRNMKTLGGLDYRCSRYSLNLSVLRILATPNVFCPKICLIFKLNLYKKEGTNRLSLMECPAPFQKCFAQTASQ